MVVSTTKVSEVPFFFFWEYSLDGKIFVKRNVLHFTLKLAKSGLVLPWGKERYGQSYM